jgi:hypothetical protein
MLFMLKRALETKFCTLRLLGVNVSAQATRNSAHCHRIKSNRLFAKIYVYPEIQILADKYSSNLKTINGIKELMSAFSVIF